MSEDKDFKPVKGMDGVYTNIDEVCKGLPEFGPIRCYICRKDVVLDFNTQTGFFERNEGGVVWTLAFHDACRSPKNTKGVSS